MLVDSTVWIDFSKGDSRSAAFLSNARSKGRVACSVLNMLETLIGVHDARKRRELEKIFATFEILPIVPEDGWQAIRIVKANTDQTGFGVIDAFLASVALREQLVLATHNERDFRGIHGLKVERPY